MDGFLFEKISGGQGLFVSCFSSCVFSRSLNFLLSLFSSFSHQKAPLPSLFTHFFPRSSAFLRLPFKSHRLTSLSCSQCFFTQDRLPLSGVILAQIQALCSSLLSSVSFFQTPHFPQRFLVGAQEIALLEFGVCFSAYR